MASRVVLPTDIPPILWFCLFLKGSALISGPRTTGTASGIAVVAPFSRQVPSRAHPGRTHTRDLSTDSNCANYRPEWCRTLLFDYLYKFPLMRKICDAHENVQRRHPLKAFRCTGTPSSESLPVCGPWWLRVLGRCPDVLQRPPANHPSSPKHTTWDKEVFGFDVRFSGLFTTTCVRTTIRTRSHNIL